MPTERRKIQNRINQRRYRMQIKNRIQMLEKAIIESGAVTRLDLSLSEDSATKYDGATSGLQSGLTSSGDGEAALETVSQNLSSWDVNFCLDLANDTDFSASPESSKNLKQPDSIFDTGSSLLSRPGSDMQSNEFHLDHHHHQFVSPWQSPPERKTQSPALTLTPRVDLINEAGRLPQPKRGNPDSGLTRGRPRKVSSTGLGIEARRLRTVQRKVQDPTEKTIASLREENKRLKELSTALVNMSDFTANKNSSGEELPHNLLVRVQNLVARSSTNMLSDSVLDNGEAVDTSHWIDERWFENDPSVRPDRIGIAQLSVLDLELSEGITGTISPGASLVPEVLSPRMDSHQFRAFGLQECSVPHGQTPPNLNYNNIYPLNTTTPPLHPLPLLISAAYLEPTFSRRLVRLIWEHAFNILTNPYIPPSEVERCFGFSLRSRSKETLIRKFQAYLELIDQPISELDRQVWNAAPDLRDEMEVGSDEWGVWIEAGKVKGYLESLGFSLADTCSEEALKIKPAVIQNQSLLERPNEHALSSQKVADKAQGRLPQQAHPVPYGSRWQPESGITNLLFDVDGNFQVPRSWLTADSNDEDEALRATFEAGTRVLFGCEQTLDRLDQYCNLPG